MGSIDLDNGVPLKTMIYKHTAKEYNTYYTLRAAIHDNPIRQNTKSDIGS